MTNRRQSKAKAVALVRQQDPATVLGLSLMLLAITLAALVG